MPRPRRPRVGARTKPTGPPTKLDDEVHETIVQLVRAGNYLVVAAEVAGISEATVHRWLSQGKAEIESTGTASSPHARFAQAVTRARAYAEAMAVSRIRAAGEKDWKAEAWLLERTRSERYGRRDEVTLAGDVGVRITKPLALDARAADLANELLATAAVGEGDGPK